MQIDWLTVGAQIVNFLILVWLLKRFLYRPVIAAMERREAAIAERLQSAADREADAAARAETLQARQQALESEAAAMLASARETADAERQRLERAAREEVAARERQWTEQLSHDRTAFLEDLKAEAERQFSILARRALADLADDDLEGRIVAVFIRRLEALGADELHNLTSDGSSRRELTIASRFPMTQAHKQRLTRVVRARLAAGAEVAYEVDEALVCGIELRAGSRHVGWSIASYLDDLEAQIAAEFDVAGDAATGDPARHAIAPQDAREPAAAASGAPSATSTEPDAVQRGSASTPSSSVLP